MRLPSFQLHMPDTVDQAISLAGSLKGDSAFVAGGTDLLVNAKEQLNCHKNLISLSGISAMKEMSRFSIGAAVTIAELIRKGEILPPLLSKTARMVAGPALRESATVGGNLLLNGRCVYFNQSKLYRCSHGACMKAEGNACIAVAQKERCYAPFSGDLAAAFLVLNAEFELAGPEGERRVPACEFYVNDGIHANVLNCAELLVRVRLSEDAFDFNCDYRKLRPRSSIDFPEAGVAVAVKKMNERASELRVALTALGPAPSLAVLRGDQLEKAKSKELADTLWKQLSPSVLAVRNTSFSPTYRREMARLFIEQMLESLLA